MNIAESEVSLWQVFNRNILVGLEGIINWNVVLKDDIYLNKLSCHNNYQI